jgi:hypothetical protein
MISDFLNSINQTKKNIMDIDPNCERVYIPFVVNKTFSYIPDALFFANILNRMPNLSKKMQYDYFFYSLKKKQRYGKWHKEKTTDTENIKIIKEYYEYSDKKALEVEKILNQDQINRLKDRLNTGGNIK